MSPERLAGAYVPSVVSDEDLRYFRDGGHGARMGWGENPTVLVTDVTKRFTELIAEYDVDGDPLCAIKRLLNTARNVDVPIVYTKAIDGEYELDVYRGIKGEKKFEEPSLSSEQNRVHPDIAPRQTDVVIEKPRHSAFLDTHLATILHHMNIDTLVVVGLVTSVCVRSTVIDAFSHNFRSIVPIECVGDPCPILEETSLFQMDMKFADVTPLAEVRANLTSAEP